MVLSYIYYRFHKSKHVSQYKERMHINEENHFLALANAKKDYNKAIENLALKHENELKHQENQYLSQMQLLKSEISKLNNEKTELMISLNTAILRAEFNIIRSQNHE